MILRTKLSAGGSIEKQRDRAHTLGQLAQPWRRRPPLATRQQMDLLVRLQFATARGNKSPIGTSTARENKTNGDVLGMRPLTINKGCTGGRWVVESWSVLG